MLTDETYGDFELTLEVKPDWGVCPGLFLRSTEKGQCYQVMIDYGEQGNIGELYREGLDGRTNRTYQLQGIYRDAEKKILQDTSAKPVRKNELDLGGTLQFPVADWSRIWRSHDWNTIRASIKGNPPRITTHLNEHFMTQYTSDQKFEGTLENRGFLAVQVHGGKAWPTGAKIRFRNLRLKGL